MVNIRRMTPISAITSTFPEELMSLRRYGPAIIPVMRYPIIAGILIRVKIKFTKIDRAKIMTISLSTPISMKNNADLKVSI